MEPLAQAGTLHWEMRKPAADRSPLGVLGWSGTRGDTQDAIEAYERAMAFDDPRITSSAKLYIEMIREEHPTSGHG